MGIKFNCKVTGISKLEKKINTIIKQLPNTIQESVEEILKNMQQSAIKIEYGHNSEGILVELIDYSNNEIKGRVYTDKTNFPHAMFEHFGTGQFAEMEHIGTSKHFIESGYTEWYIPVNKIDKTLHYPIKIIQGKQFYVAHGAKANHFMTEAEFKTRSQNVEKVKKQISKMLKEVCK